MKYIWELMAQAKAEEIEPEQITFKKAEEFSPYMEMSFENLNDKHVPNIAQVNPYYRFTSVFKDYFNPDGEDEDIIRKQLFNVIVHYLAELDTYMGMTWREYEILLLIEDIKLGVFGKQTQEDFEFFKPVEKKIVCENVLRLYTIGEGIFLFQDIVKKLYPDSMVYGNLADKDVLMTHLFVKETDVDRRRIEVLKKLLLPCFYEVEIYWISLFGLLGVDVTMKQEEFLMY